MLVSRRVGLGLCLFVATTGCGGEDGSTTAPTPSAPVVVVPATPTPAPTASITPQPTPEPTPTPQPTPEPTPPPTPTPQPSPTVVPEPTTSPLPAPVPPTPTPTAPPIVSIVVGQDFTVVGQNLWIFDKSDGDHLLKGGTIRRLSDLSYLGFFSHNISHSASAKYFGGTDTVMLGNAGDANSRAPRIDLFPGFSRYGVRSFIDWFNAETTPRVSIPLLNYAADGTTVTRSVFPDKGRRGASAVWVDAQTIIVYGFGLNNGLTATTVRLGMGGEDLSAEGFGTFVAGRGAREYNGTARSLRTYVSPHQGTTQGADYRNGRLYVGWTAQAPTQRTVQVLEMELNPSGSLDLITNYKFQPRRADGTPVRFETQGVTFRGDELIVGAIRDDEYSSVYRFDSATTATDIYPR